MSIISDIESFSPGAKKFLGFSAINLISWQCIVGQFLVLFGRSIGMPASWVGTLVSFIPLSMLLVIFSVPIVEQYGSKKVMMVTWMLRNLAVIPVLTIPWLIPIWGERSAWYVLMLSTFGFSLARATGVAAWYPWIHELVPKRLMGKYLSVESSIMQTMNVLVIFAIAKVLGMVEYSNRFYYVYSTGIVAGVVSSFYILTIPGGVASISTDTHNGRFSAIMAVTKDPKYCKFMLLAILSMSSFVWLNVSSILCLRDVLKQSDFNIMVLYAIGAIGVALSIRLVSHLAGKMKSQKSLTLMLLFQGIISASWFFLVSGSSLVPYLVIPVVALGTISAVVIFIFASQQMLGLVKQEHKVGYTSVWVIGTSISTGLPPIMAGWFINHLDLLGYQFCFGISSISALVGAWFWYRFNLDERDQFYELQPHIRHFQPMRSLQRLVWIVLGTNRKK